MKFKTIKNKKKLIIIFNIRLKFLTLISRAAFVMAWFSDKRRTSSYTGFDHIADVIWRVSYDDDVVDTRAGTRGRLKDDTS